MVSILWYLVSIGGDIIGRQTAVNRVEKAIRTFYGDTPAESPRPLPPNLSLEMGGDYWSGWIWQRAGNLIGDGLFICGFQWGAREIMFSWRFCMWLYLVSANELIITANNLEGENKLTYGQTFALILLTTPVGILWKVSYRT
jgi:hypothetical protein